MNEIPPQDQQTLITNGQATTADVPAMHLFGDVWITGDGIVSLWVGAAVGVSALWLAFKQNRLGQQNLKHELFERRFEIFTAFDNFFHTIHHMSYSI